ncbi:MAG: helix-turn-helix transcriptional regulator, partial [Clostridia bacterium]|nr:helix-turn-helix transcriptional regulator [Clostridia bacterium]
MDLRKNGSLLRDLRKARGMTQKDVADRVGVVPKTVSKWETGHGFPDVSTISALADVLGVSERILLSGDLIKN